MLANEGLGWYEKVCPVQPPVVILVGFMLGTTANAMANMKALVERYGPAPKAFLVVPMVGAFFIDFTNAIIITLFVNWLR